MRGLLAATLILRGVVDQMDAGFAAIEWSDDTITHLPLSALPARTAEGDAVVLRVRAHNLRRDLRHRIRPRVRPVNTRRPRVRDRERER